MKGGFVSLFESGSHVSMFSTQILIARMLRKLKIYSFKMQLQITSFNLPLDVIPSKKLNVCNVIQDVSDSFSLEIKQKLFRQRNNSTELTKKLPDDKFTTVTGKHRSEYYENKRRYAKACHILRKAEQGHSLGEELTEEHRNSVKYATNHQMHVQVSPTQTHGSHSAQRWIKLISTRF